MSTRSKVKVAAVAAAALAAAGGGVGIAATQLSPTEQSDAIVADAAEQLGVEASELDAALTKALQNRVDAAVEDGRLTEAQGEELKQRLADGNVPLVGLGPGGPGMHGHHRLLDLSAAAAFLGVPQAELRARLADGDTLAEVAQAEGKTADGLVAALLSAARERLAEAVEVGRLTEEQRAEKLEGLEERIEDAVQNGLPGPRWHHGGMGRPGMAPDTAPDES